MGIIVEPRKWQESSWRVGAMTSNSAFLSLSSRDALKSLRNLAIPFHTDRNESLILLFIPDVVWLSGPAVTFSSRQIYQFSRDRRLIKQLGHLATEFNSIEQMNLKNAIMNITNKTSSSKLFPSVQYRRRQSVCEKPSRRLDRL